ncbi:MAG: HDOD domain-containing protein [Magnetococcales bacterium]|nr:HDOD domain-containing protein [Magnetococcales bacterium]
MEVKESREEKRRLARAERLLEDLTMPSRPDVLLEVMRAQSGFAPDPVAVTDLILTDMTLAAAVLAAANTTLPGWKRKLISIEGAVALLGFERVRAIVSEQFLSAPLVARDGPFQSLRLRSVEAGRVAARLARMLPDVAPHCLNGYLPAVAPDDAYAAGLLHDCGLIPMLRAFPDYAIFCREAHGQGGVVDLVAAENERFGTNHCLTGYLMASSWRLPESLCRIIRVHHRIEDFNRPGEKVRERQHLVLRAILHLSASVCGGETRGSWLVVEERIAAFFGLESARLEDVRMGIDPV